MWGFTLWVLWSWSYLCVVSHFYFEVGHQGLSLIIPLQMDEEFALPLDTAEIPQYTGLSLGKKLSLFLIIVKPFKKIVFLELVDRSSVVQMKRLIHNWWHWLFTDPMPVRVLRLSFSNCTALERELWKEKTKKFKVPRWWSDALTAHGIFWKWFV